MGIGKKIAALFFVTALTAAAAMAQKKITEGVVTYTVSYELPADKQQIAGMLPKEITCYFRGDSTAAIVVQGPATIKGVSVFKSNYHSLIIDVPSASKKIVVVLTPGEVQLENAAVPQFTGKKETEKQVISGYNCTKTTVTDPKANASYELWTTNDINMPPTSVSRAMSSFGGVPVKFVTFNNLIKINATIKEIKEEPVPAGFFTANKDYKPMSYPELKAMSGGR